MSKSCLFQAGYLLDLGFVDAVVAGANNSTANVIRAALTTVGTAENLKTVSGSFIMEKGDQIYLYSDAAVVIEPTIKQLSDIASASVKTWNSLLESEGEAVVSFLSFSTKGSARHENAEKVVKAHQLFSQANPDIVSDGEMQFDAAISSQVGKSKAPNSLVPGKTNIFIFPNLDAGNIGYKMTQRLAGFNAFGPILQGLRLPYCDLSRGATAKDIAVTAYIALLQSDK